MKKFLVRIICCFVPSRQKRHEIRSFFFKKEERLANLESLCFDLYEQINNGASVNPNVMPNIKIDKNNNAVFESGLYYSNQHQLKFDNNAYCLYRNFVASGTVIGQYSYIGAYTKIDNDVKIGSYCSISDNVIIGATIHPQDWLSTSPFQYDKWIDKDCTKLPWTISKETVIGHDVWIGAHVIIQSGVHVGNGAIIGSGAIVTHDVPDYAVVVGVPAKIIKYRFPENIIRELNDIQWWELPHNKIQKLPFNNIKKCLKELKK